MMIDIKLMIKTEANTDEYSAKMQQQSITLETDLTKIAHIKSKLSTNQLKFSSESIAQAILIFHKHTAIKSDHD